MENSSLLLLHSVLTLFAFSCAAAPTESVRCGIHVYPRCYDHDTMKAHDEGTKCGEKLENVCIKCPTDKNERICVSPNQAGNVTSQAAALPATSTPSAAPAQNAFPAVATIPAAPQKGKGKSTR